MNVNEYVVTLPGTVLAIFDQTRPLVLCWIVYDALLLLPMTQFSLAVLVVLVTIEPVRLVGAVGAIVSFKVTTGEGVEADALFTLTR